MDLKNSGKLSQKGVGKIMNCREFRKHLDDYLAIEPDGSRQAEMAKHLAECSLCADEYKLAQKAIASVGLSHTLKASPQLKERIMSEISVIDSSVHKPTVHRPLRTYLPRPYLAACAAVALLIVATLFMFPPGPSNNGPGNNDSGNNGPGPPGVRASMLPAFSLLSQAYAAEGNLFEGDEIVHIVNEIVVEPVNDPALASARWLPIVSLEATGKLRFHQLKLATEPGKGQTVKGQAWFDPGTGRFSRVLTVDQRPIFANAYDGENVYLYLYDNSPGSTARVVKHKKTPDFEAPKNPAQFLGIAAGLPNRIDMKNKSLVSDAGEVTLADGSEGRLVKLANPSPEGQGKLPNTYWVFTIREDNNTIAKMEWMAKGESLLLVRRVKTATVQSPGVSWNLAGIDSQVAQIPRKSSIGISSDMVVQDETVQQMIEIADFKTYIFANDPPWAGQRKITDILDIVSPPKRMFMLTYRAKDGRHVVLVQAPTYNKMLGPVIKKAGKLVYTSPKGIKVWSGAKDKWLAGILLQSARGEIKDLPSEDRTGFVLETKEGTFPTLAINGQITEKELHSLIDSLVPAED